MTDDIHTCSYFCERPECVRRQRDELRERCEKLRAALTMFCVRTRCEEYEGPPATVWVEETCMLCAASWSGAEPERHAEGCLAA